VLRSPAVQDFVAKSSVGTTRESLNTKILKSIPILHPVYSEQMRVAEILAELDEGIEQTEVLIAKHRRIKLGLMQDLFTRGITSDVRLRPTRARAPHLYRKSPLGWIPEDWDEAPAKKLCQPITKGTTPIESPPPEGSSAIPFLRVQNLSFDGRLEFDEDRTYVSLSVARGGLARSRVFPGDVLMNIVGPPLGKVSMVPETFPECNINQAIAIFRPLRLELRSYLRWYLLSDIAAQWFLRRVRRTSGQVNITLEMCSQLPVPYPRNVAEIGMITDRLDGIQGLIESEEDHRHKLGMIKSGLMHDLLSGRVRVNVGGAVTT
jgi:type I restriction enzyme S subunit